MTNDVLDSVAIHIAKNRAHEIGHVRSDVFGQLLRAVQIHNLQQCGVRLRSLVKLRGIEIDNLFFAVAVQVADGRQRKMIVPRPARVHPKLGRGSRHIVGSQRGSIKLRQNVFFPVAGQIFNRHTVELDIVGSDKLRRNLPVGVEQVDIRGFDKYRGCGCHDDLPRAVAIKISGRNRNDALTIRQLQIGQPLERTLTVEAIDRGVLLGNNLFVAIAIQVIGGKEFHIGFIHRDIQHLLFQNGVALLQKHLHRIVRPVHRRASHRENKVIFRNVGIGKGAEIPQRKIRGVQTQRRGDLRNLNLNIGHGLSPGSGADNNLRAVALPQLTDTKGLPDRKMRR